MRRREDVAVLHRLADADRGRLLADRDVQEAGQLAGAEPLLHLLLEAADQQHLAEELAQPVLRERRALLLDLCHGRQSTTPLCSAAVWRSSTVGRDRGRPRRTTGATRGCGCRSRTTLRPPAPTRCSAPLARGGRATRSASTSSRRGAGVHPSASAAPCSGSTTRRSHGTLELVGSTSAPRPRRGRRGRRSPSRGTRCSRRCRRDWSDLYLELELDSSDYVARASLNMSPLNARRSPARTALRFRAARSFGYGASPEMVRRCLERCDRGLDPRPSCGCCASSPTRVPSARRALSGRSAGGRYDRLDRRGHDPVSWLMIEPGWAVVGSDGEEIGSVSRFDADESNATSSDGLEVSTGLLGAARYVPAERVARIFEGRSSSTSPGTSCAPAVRSPSRARSSRRSSSAAARSRRRSSSASTSSGSRRSTRS